MPPKVEKSAGLETVDETVKRAQALTGSINANDLANPPAAPELTEPAEAPPVDRSRIDSASQGTREFIQSESQNAAALAERRAEFAGLSDEPGLQDILQQGREDAGIPDSLRELKDINLQLAARGTQSGLRKVEIESEGQGAMQGVRSLNQEDREQAVRDAGLTARAQVLQGNIETASALVSEAVQMAYQDRTLRNNNLLAQISDLRGVVDNETQQLLNKEQRSYEADQAKVEQVKTAVSSALQSGATSQTEVAFLTDPNTTDDERLAMAQLIQARGSTEMRDLQTQSARMDLAVKARQLAKLNQPIVATRSTSVIDVDGVKKLIDTQTGAEIASFEEDVSTDEIKQARDIKFSNTLDTLGNHPGMSKAVGTNKLARFTPFKADVMTGEVSDFVGSVQNVVKQLTLNSYAEAKAQGLTFGAMSEAEWDILGNAATKINAWERTRDDGSVYYDTSENKFQKELDSLSQFSKLVAVNSGVEPASVGVSEMEDGTMWTVNSDGSYTKIK